MQNAELFAGSGMGPTLNRLCPNVVLRHQR